jgi:Neurotransmitter-gated ion-channel ligand binding domain
MRRLVAAFVVLLGAFAAHAAPADKDVLPPGLELPVRVRVALKVLNVLKVEEVAGQARLHIELTQRWRDPRLVFNAVENGLSRMDRVGEDADEFLKTIWRPGLVIDNQVDDPDGRSVALSVHANGEAVLIERFESNFRFRMNMDAFPFDKQALALVLSLPRYAKQEALLLTTEADRRLSGIEPQLSVVDWAPVDLRFSSEEGMGWNARSFSRLNATLTLARHAERYLLRIFVPILAVLAVSIFVLWSPGLKEEGKGGLIFSSLLALAAISFTFESSFPGSISLNTPVAQMISLGYLYLVVVLMLEIMLASSIANPAARFHAVSVEARRQIKWALPAIMVIICVGAAVRALPA